MALLVLQLGDALTQSGVFNVSGDIVLVGLTVLFVSLFSKWPKVETKYQGSKLCNQAIAEDCVTDQKSQNISVGLRKGSSVKASTNKTLHNYDKPMEIKSGFLETDLGYKDWNISTYWR